MLLSELFNKVFPWKWTERDDEDTKYWCAEFDTGTYFTQFLQSKKVSYDVTFTNLGNDHPDDPNPSNDLWMVEFMVQGMIWPKSVELTGTGQAAAVISTVITIIQDFVQSHRGCKIGFSANGVSRNKLYSTIVRRMAPTAKILNAGGETVYTINTQ